MSPQRGGPNGTVHVVGAGVAGLSAALALARAGRRVTMHEAAPVAGGRCNAGGLHALVGAQAATRRLLAAIGSADAWIAPEPEGLPLLDLLGGVARRVAPSPFAWRDATQRPPGVSAGGIRALLGMALGLTDRPLTEALARHSALLDGYAAPLAAAALHLRPEDASSARFGQVLRGLRAAPDIAVAREGPGQDLIAPALAALRAAGGTFQRGSRLRALTAPEGRVTALHLGEGSLPVGDGDAVLLALPPWEAARLIPGLKVPERHAAIRCLHFDRAAPGPVRLLAATGGALASALVRPSGILALPVPDLADETATAARLWGELRRVAAAFGLPGPWPETPPPWQEARELRAVARNGVGFAPHAPRRPWRNLALAGDWTWPGLPAGIEAAVRSGEAAAAALLRRAPSR